MKALVWTSPRMFEEQSVPNPVPGAGEVLIKVQYSGICGSDLSGYLGENSLRKPPLIMGHEFTGEVVEIGTKVQSINSGDIVTVNPLVSCGNCRDCRNGMPQYCARKQIIGIHRPGAFAELVAVPEQNCHLVSDVISGALTEPLACSIRAVRQAHVELGDNVVVFGAGIIGLFALKVAGLSGANHRILVDTNESRLSLGRFFGATATIHAPVNDIKGAISDIVDGPIQRVIDAVGLDVTRKQSAEITSPGGRVVWIGLHEDMTHVPGNLIVRNEIEIAGSFCYSEHDFATAHAMIEHKVVQAESPWFDIRPLETVKQCFDEQIDGGAHFPKLMLKV